jgi:CNT family concentrative nucleoside transporter
MILQGLFGVLLLTALAWGLSENRRAAPVRVVVAGLALQFGLAALFLKVPLFQDVFLALNRVVAALQTATEAGTSFVFGYLGGGALPFQESYPGASFILAFKALPLILVMSALSALLWHWRILPLVVRGFSFVLQRTMAVSGPLGVGAAANIFVGMVEAPLLIRPCLKAMSRSELFALMVCGMATIAGTVMVLYAGFLEGVVANPVGHILTASIISAPAAIMVARLMVPESGATAEPPPVPGAEYASAMEAVTRGTADGVTLLINVVAMLIVLVALVTLVNLTLGLLPDWGGAAITLQRLLGYLLAPVAWLMGVPWAEATTAGALLGSKIVLNELIAYLDLAKLAPDALSDRSRLIMTYALCGFANFGSLGIMIGGLGTMAPERRPEVVALGLKSIVAGTIATCLTGAVVGVL